MRTRAAVATIAVLSALGAFACRDVSSPTRPQAPSLAKPSGNTVKNVSVAPSTATVAVGGKVQLTASARGAGGRPVTNATFTWTSSAPAFATVTAVSPTSAEVTGVAPGTATITATETNSGKRGSSTVTVTGSPPPSGDPVLVGAGDIADCGSTVTGDDATAALLDGIAGTVANFGDNAYPNGTLSEYTNCYGPNWGRHKARTMPSAGNHEYNTAGAVGYYDYFGAAAGDRDKGYYSYNLGDWHVVVLNSNLSMLADSPQVQWLRADLAANPRACTLAYWHHPRFNSGESHGDNPATQPLWQALYDANADVILNGHEHIYERFAPQTPTGAADPARGIRQFTVGTGGRSHYTVGTPKPNSEVANGSTYGVIKLTLSASSYAWEFIPVAGATFRDSGSASCH